jgi:hypothetical protein
MLRMMGAVAGVSVLAPELFAEQDPASLPRPRRIRYIKPKQPVTAVIVGHGARGSLYGGFAQAMPDEWKIVGVAEPIEYRRDAAIRLHGIAPEHAFVTWEHVFGVPKFADVVIVTTPDKLHHGPAMAALAQGYDLLLEKPIATSWRECRDILVRANEKKAIVAVCHVLRYAPYFQQMKAVVESGMLGDVVSVQHLEPVGHLHMSHSFVRGNWRNSKESSPIILSKSCHDLDILRWVIDRPCRRVSSFGSLSFFCRQNAPEGAPQYCIEGCPVEEKCPYHAPNVYVYKKQWGTEHIVSEDRSDEGILKALRTSQYGRCVFQSDNDVCDHQVTNMEFDGGVTAAFSLEGMTSYGGRRTRIFCKQGDIVGDENALDVFDFVRGARTRWDVSRAAEDLSGHGGGDFRLVRDFIQAVTRRDVDLLTSNLATSMESHLIAFRAEESRNGGGKVLGVDLASR